MKLMKRAAILCLCLMMVFSLVPAVQAEAATVTKQGVYFGVFDTSPATRKVSGIVRVTWKGKKLIMRGQPLYDKSEKEFIKNAGSKQLKSGKRVFKLSSRTSYYKGSKKISVAKAKKILKKYNKTSLKHGLAISVKNKKVYRIFFQ